MTIDDAARATRRYDWKGRGERWYAYEVESGNAMTGPMAYQQAKAACDRLNAEAFLRAVREPSEVMVLAAADSTLGGSPDENWIYHIWRAMIDAAIKEIEAHG